MNPMILVPQLCAAIIYCQEFYLVIKGVVELPFIIIIRILLHPESSAAVNTAQICNASDSLHVR